jgi:hypothetical protein
LSACNCYNSDLSSQSSSIGGFWMTAILAGMSISFSLPI